MAMLFNDLLSQAGIDPANVRLLRHHTAIGLGSQSLYDLWSRDRKAFELYQSTQDSSKTLFRSGSVWAAFVSPGGGRTLFAGLYDAEFVDQRAATWDCPYRGGKPGGGAPIDYFKTRLRPELSELAGQLEIEWDRTSLRTWARYAQRAPFPLLSSTLPVTNPTDMAVAGLAKALKEAGFTELHRTKKVAGFGQAGTHVYLKLNTEKNALVLHPRFFDLADKLAEIPGTEFERPLRPYINSNMRNLAVYESPSRNSKSRYGFAISVAPSSVPALAKVLFDGRWVDTAEGAVRLLGDEDEPLTESERLTAARIGQGEFRYSLISIWNGACSVLGVDHLRLLRASHIKPWRAATNRERLDPYNGLLLSAHIDALFDCGLVSFEDDGQMLVSSALGDSNFAKLGIPQDSAISGLRDRHFPYLAYHRSEVFLG